MAILVAMSNAFNGKKKAYTSETQNSEGATREWSDITGLCEV